MGAQPEQCHVARLATLQRAAKGSDLSAARLAVPMPPVAVILLRVKEAVPHALLSVPTCGRDERIQFYIVLTSIVVIFLVIENVYFADTAFAFARITENIVHRSIGGATLGVEPTPQKRGPLPILSWRRGRLPNSLARPRRPTPSLVSQFPFMHFLDTPWMRLKRTLELLPVVVAMGPLDCRAARPMVRLGMEMQGRVYVDDYMVEIAGAHLEDPADQSARGLQRKQSAALTSARPGLGSCA